MVTSQPQIDPPRGWFSGVVPVQAVVARSTSAVVVLIEVRCFFEGCLLEFSTRSSYPSGTLTEQETFELDARLFQSGAHQDADPAPDPSLLRFAASQRSGLSTTTLGSADARLSRKLPDWVFVNTGGVVTRDSEFRYYDQPCWLSPLPDPEDLFLRTTWPEFDIVDQEFTLDGERIVRESQKSKQFPM